MWDPLAQPSTVTSLHYALKLEPGDENVFDRPLFSQVCSCFVGVKNIIALSFYSY